MTKAERSDPNSVIIMKSVIQKCSWASTLASALLRLGAQAIFLLGIYGCTGGSVNTNQNEADWMSSITRIDFVAATNTPAAPQTLTIENTGGRGELRVISQPQWLNVAIESTTVSSGESSTVTLAASTCTTEASEQGELILGSSVERSITITLTRSCVISRIDIALDRVYFMQSTTQADSLQSLNEQVPLVANREALVRVFVRGTGSIFGVEPSVVLHYETPDGNQGDIALYGPGILPSLIEEQYLIETFNALVPPEVIQVGTRFYVSVDEENAFLENEEANNRYPTSGFQNLNVLDVPEMDIVVVPVIVNNVTPNTSSVRLDSLFSATFSMMPISSYRYEVTQAITFDGTDWQDLLDVIENIQIANKEPDRYYLGLAGHPLEITNNSFVAGIGYIGLRTAAALTFPDTIAHEFGHNFGRFHSPCGQPDSVDPNYPYENGDLGAYGADLVNYQLILREGNEDIMSYCTSQWISNYTYKKIIERIGTRSALSVNSQSQQKSLSTQKNSDNWITVTGSMDSNNMPVIEHLWLDNNSRIYQPDFTQATDYKIALIDENNRTISQSQIRTYLADHGSEQRFGLSIKKSGISSLKSIQILYQDTIMDEIPLALDNRISKQEVSAQSMSAKRIDPFSVKVNWQSGVRNIIRDGESQAILAISDSGNILVKTASSTILLESPITYSKTSMLVE